MTTPATARETLERLAEIVRVEIYLKDAKAMAALDNLLALADTLASALEEHACVEKPELGWTRNHYPNHSCWSALRAPEAP